jgi:Ca2+-binding EF-hand superfamily protein
MVLPFLFLAALAPAEPIMVTGHQWAPFISPMGEPFRARTATDDTLADWFNQADRNHDGVLTPAEMQADAERFFATLDSDHDGEIGPDEIAAYEYDIAPDVQVMSRTKRVPGQAATPVVRPVDTDLDASRRDRRAHRDEDYASLGLGGALQGAARYSLLNIPEPVAAADADFNRAITLDEFRQAALERFALLDTARQARLTLSQLEAMPHAPTGKAQRGKLYDDRPDRRIGAPLPGAP